MPQLSVSGKRRLGECHTELQALFFAVIAKTDFTVLCGFRGQKEQQEAYLTGHSKAQWGESPHNCVPSMAVDVTPYPIDWKNITRMKEFARVVKETALELGIKITWGGDFKDFVDMPHFELTDYKTRSKK